MSSKNYWPHFIIGLVIFAIALGVWTVRVAMQNPVELDNSFMMRYQDVDNNYYQIEQAAKRFDSNYQLSFANKKLTLGKNSLRFRITDKAGNPVDADLQILVTRPDTSKYDQKLETHCKSGSCTVDVDLQKEGRWDINVKAIIDEQTYRFFKFKRSTRRILEDNLKKS